MISYDPDDENWSPAGWLGAYADVLYSEYRDYWELGASPEDSDLTEDQRTHFLRLKAIADALTQCLHSLRPSATLVRSTAEMLADLGVDQAVDTDLAVKVARGMQRHPIIRDALRLDLASQAADVLLAGAEGRAAFLIALMTSQPLSDRAAAYLDRATRLYLWGFEPETVVMCASVLEAAYESRFPPESMFSLQIRKTEKEYEASQYEQAALAAGLYSKADKDLARKIRRARNDTLHCAPNTALGAREALTATAALLEKLFANTTD